MVKVGVESADDLDIEKITEKAVGQLKYGRDNRVVRGVLARDHHLFCVFNDQHRILVLQKEGYKRWLEQVFHKVVLDKDEFLVCKFADEVLDVGRLACSRFSMQQDDAR